MLPAWATIVLTLGTTVLGALAGVSGALGGAWLQGRFDREARWWDKMSASADSFYRSVHLANHRLRTAANYAIDMPEWRGSVHDYSVERARATLEDAVAAVDAVHAELASVDLFFGEKSPAATAAGDLLRTLRAQVEALRKDPSEVGDYASALISDMDASRSFQTAIASALGGATPGQQDPPRLTETGAGRRAREGK